MVLFSVRFAGAIVAVIYYRETPLVSVKLVLYLAPTKACASFPAEGKNRRR